MADWSLIKIPEENKLSYDIQKFVNNCLKVKNIGRHEKKYKMLVTISKILLVFLVMVVFITSWHMSD